MPTQASVLRCRVPNVITTVENWSGLLAAARKGRIGDDLVVQTPYGDSGKTTFFISSEADWNRHRKDITGQEVKVMKRINNRPVAVEAVLTRCGTVVGPFMSELTGYARLTPYRGGWCGNEMFPTVLEGKQRLKASRLVRRLGDRLAAEGYRGFFEVDVLVDTDSDEVYRGELNPRISGASAITNVTRAGTLVIRVVLEHRGDLLGRHPQDGLNAVQEVVRWAAFSAFPAGCDRLDHGYPPGELRLADAESGSCDRQGTGALKSSRLRTVDPVGGRTTANSDAVSPSTSIRRLEWRGAGVDPASQRRKVPTEMPSSAAARSPLPSETLQAMSAALRSPADASPGPVGEPQHTAVPSITGAGRGSLAVRACTPAR